MRTGDAIRILEDAEISASSIPVDLWKLLQRHCISVSTDDFRDMSQAGMVIGSVRVLSDSKIAIKLNGILPSSGHRFASAILCAHFFLGHADVSGEEMISRVFTPEAMEAKRLAVDILLPAPALKKVLAENAFDTLADLGNLSGVTDERAVLERIGRLLSFDA